MANASMGKGTTFSVKVGSATAVKVKGLKSIAGLGGGTASVQDASDLDSTAKEKLFGLPDEGQLKLSFNLIETDPGQVALRKARTDGVTVQGEVKLKSGKTYTMSLGILSAEINIATDTINTLEVTGEIDGAVVETNAP